MKKLIISTCLISMLFTMCEKQEDNDGTLAFSSLNGNNYILQVDRVIFNSPDMQFPFDDLQEIEHFMTIEHIEYDVSFSENGQIVTIEPGTLRGEIKNEDLESRQYELVEGVFAGGKFVVWKNNEKFDGELTIYGSGVPIVLCDSGNLELVTK